MQNPSKLYNDIQTNPSSALPGQEKTKAIFKQAKAIITNLLNYSWAFFEPIIARLSLFPSKLPGISKIKHISAVTGQNSMKFET